jgi:hypothetical protein
VSDIKWTDNRITPPPRDPETEHHWSGWPGAFCLKCGSEDSREVTLADGLDVDEAANAETPCAVRGVLKWNTATKQWDLHRNVP